MVEALTPCTKQPQKQDVRFRQTTAAMLEVLTYTPSIADARIYNTRSACTNSASGTHRALVGARSACHLHIEQPAGLAQHADTPSAQVQTQRASRSMRACCGGDANSAPARTRRWIRANTPCARVSLRLRAGFSAACGHPPRQAPHHAC